MQKKKLAEAGIIIAENQLKKAEAAAAADPPAAELPAAAPSVSASESTKNILTTMQWLSVISIFVPLVGLYYKPEEIKKVLTKKPPQTPPPSPVDVVPPEPQTKEGICPMD